MHYSIAPSIYLAEIGRDVLLLDIQKQHYKLLPWTQKTQFSPQRFFTEILAVAGASVQQEPYQDAFAMCVRAGWLHERTPGEEVPSPLIRLRRCPCWFPLQLETVIRFQQIDGFLRRQQFMPLTQALMTLPVQSGTALRPQQDRIIRTVREMARIYRQPKTCLHQCLVICWMLRDRHIPAEVAIRVQQYPLRSHMIVVNGAEVLSWRPGLRSATTLEHYLSASTLLFRSGDFSTHYRRQEVNA